jgi:hypothetical protein
LAENRVGGASGWQNIGLAENRVGGEPGWRRTGLAERLTARKESVNKEILYLRN